MLLNEWYAKALVGVDLSSQTARRFFELVLRGKVEQEVVKKFLVILARKGEEATEIKGCLQAILGLERRRKIQVDYLVDVCGTGGDRKNTFNVSTVSGFVIAAAGGNVAKHGNRAVSSQTGSSDLMEALGVNLDVGFEHMSRILRQCHFGYFHAPFYHPSFSRFQGLRRQLRLSTLFNVLGPLLNPVELEYQIVGVSDPRWLRPVAEALKLLGRKRAAVIRSQDGLDELSTSASNEIVYLQGRRLKYFQLEPKRFGFSRAKISDYRGSDIYTNKKIVLEILNGRLQGPPLEIVLLNSAFTLWLMGIAKTMQEGIERSQWVIQTGRARSVLAVFRQLSRGVAL